MDVIVYTLDKLSVGLPNLSYDKLLQICFVVEETRS